MYLMLVRRIYSSNTGVYQPLSEQSQGRDAQQLPLAMYLGRKATEDSVSCEPTQPIALPCRADLQIFSTALVLGKQHNYTNTVNMTAEKACK